MVKIFHAFAVATLLLNSCAPRSSGSEGCASAENNVSTTISSDTSKLGQHINITVFKPASANFKYVFIDNSGQKERFSVPGPSDSYLQAVLFYDSAILRTLQMKYFNVDYPTPHYERQEFAFDWLDSSIKNELLASDSNYHGHPDFFLGMGSTGKIWFLKNKILIIKSTQ